MFFFFLNEEDSDGADSDEELEEVDEEELTELQNEADIEHFNAVLAQAQAMAVKAEREAAGEKPKRKRRYMGNSNRTKRHHAQRRRELAGTGQKLISSMFTKKRQPESIKTPPDIVEVVDDSDSDRDSSDADDDEIEVSLKELFPGEQAVSPLQA
jgi:hypothetical protein